MPTETRCKCGQCVLRVTVGKPAWWTNIGGEHDPRWARVNGKCPACE